VLNEGSDPPIQIDDTQLDFFSLNHYDLGTHQILLTATLDVNPIIEVSLQLTVDIKCAMITLQF
jgi:hypothetical protein